MFTFYYGDTNLSLNSAIEYFRESCRDIQMAPSAEIAQGRRQSLEDYQKHYYAAASRMRSDEMEYVLMQKDFAQSELDERLWRKWYYYPDILTHAKNVLHITGERVTREALKSLLWDSYSDEYTLSDEDMVFNKDSFRRKFSDYLYGKVCTIVDSAKIVGTMTESQAKIVSFYLSWGTTSDIHSLTEKGLKSYTIGRGETLKREQVNAWYPKKTQAAA